MTTGLHGDATAVCQRLALRLQYSGAPHPVAGAVVLAARGHLGLTRLEFAEVVGIHVAVLGDLEEGRVSFGQLPHEIDWVLSRIEGLDLLALADLALATRCGAVVDACQHDTSCSDA